MFDMNGKQVIKQQVSGATNVWDLQKFTGGSYQVIIIDKEQARTNLRIIKE